jgi:hypothetical protein
VNQCGAAGPAGRLRNFNLKIRVTCILTRSLGNFKLSDFFILSQLQTTWNQSLALALEWHVQVNLERGSERVGRVESYHWYDSDITMMHHHDKQDLQCQRHSGCQWQWQPVAVTPLQLQHCNLVETIFQRTSH